MPRWWLKAPPEQAEADGALEELLTGQPVRGLLHLGTLDANPGARAPGPELDAALAVSCGPLLAATRSLTVTEGQAGPRLWLVTRGATGADGAPVAPEQVVRVTVNSFLADGGDKFSVLRDGTDRVGGALDLDALEAHLAPSLTGAPITVPARDRITREAPARR